MLTVDSDRACEDGDRSPTSCPVAILRVLESRTAASTNILSTCYVLAATHRVIHVKIAPSPRCMDSLYEIQEARI